MTRSSIALERSGARSKATVDPAFLYALEQGVVESRTHIEQMSMSSTTLLRRAFPGIVFDDELISRTAFVQRLRIVGSMLASEIGPEIQRMDSCWVSDTVRGWLAMAVAADLTRSLEEILPLLRPYARDHHFAVREWAWLAARPRVVAEPLRSLAILEPLARSADANERRFVLELTRPRSVWGAHVRLFKQTPEVAQPVLTLLRCDESPYVRTALGNWINDASRTRPDWVRALTANWARDCDCAGTMAVVRQGRRSLNCET
jgi:3-methyladenine DNA glycosylase AlkC